MNSYVLYAHNTTFYEQDIHISSDLPLDEF
ncbi:hypothetical protein BA6E_125434 [Bacteroidales bacterium 6E]|nr:hypothetical protein BA6E_125434 [Bacteroidales bacterium 6E]